MMCVIDSAIDYCVKKGKKAEAIRRYIKMKYKINIDTASIQKRLQLNRKMDIA